MLYSKSRDGEKRSEIKRTDEKKSVMYSELFWSTIIGGGTVYVHVYIWG